MQGEVGAAKVHSQREVAEADEEGERLEEGEEAREDGAPAGLDQLQAECRVRQIRSVGRGPTTQQKPSHRGPGSPAEVAPR